MLQTMNRHRQRSLLIVALSIVLMMMHAPALFPSASAQSYVRIKNLWKGTYLYQSAGVVKYGTPAVTDLTSQWVIENDTATGTKRIKNRSTNQYMHIENLTGSVQAGAIQTAWASARWFVDTAATAGHSLLRNAWHTNEYIHVENQNGNAQYGTICTCWGSAQWLLEPVGTTPTTVPPTSTSVPPTSTGVPPTSTAVPPTSTTGPTSTPQSGQSAYPAGVAWAIPGTIQAENFDNGGQGVAFHDTDTTNTGGQYRTTGVDIQATTDAGGGFNVGWTVTNEWLEYTVDVPTAGTYTLFARVASNATTGNLRVEFNGVDKTGSMGVGSTGGWQNWIDISRTVSLSAGQQVMRVYMLGGDFNLNFLRFTSGGATPTTVPPTTVPPTTVPPTTVPPTTVPPTGRGATVPWIEYEAENSNTTGSILGPSRTFGQIATEASGRRAVQLSANGQFVEFSAAQTANSIVVRYVIPDSTGGGGINATLSLYVNGSFRQKINLTSKYAWSYGGEAQAFNTPNSGGAHHFFDEARALVASIPAGATVKLQKDSTDTAAYYVVDLIDLEQVGAPLSMPAGFLSIVSDCGATANDGTEDGQRIQDCINRGKAEGRGVWIPQGTFNMNAQLQSSMGAMVDNVTIRGAGMWYSVLSGFWARFHCTGSNCRYYNFSILGETTARDDNSPDNGFNGHAGSGSILENIWVEHTKVGYWVGNGGTPTNGLIIRNSRFRNTMADGINFCNGTSNSVVENTHLRNTGDDALASWSPSFNGGVNSNNSFRFNTVQIPWRANCFAIYGGSGNKIEDSLCYDVITYPGILIAQQFTSHAFGGTTSVQRNSLIRAGGPMWNQQHGALKLHASEGSLTGILIRDIIIDSPTFSGIQIQGPSSNNNVSFTNVQITNAGTSGIQIENNATGGATFTGVTVNGAASGGLVNHAGGNYSINRGAGNSGW